MINKISAFEHFLLDGGVNSPDCYYVNEPEDFSPEGAVNVAYINSFADRIGGDFEYAKIA